MCNYFITSLVQMRLQKKREREEESEAEKGHLKHNKGVAIYIVVNVVLCIYAPIRKSGSQLALSASNYTFLCQL